jgi:hypothetical protein
MHTTCWGSVKFVWGDGRRRSSAIANMTQACSVGSRRLAQSTCRVFVYIHWDICQHTKFYGAGWADALGPSRMWCALTEADEVRQLDGGTLVLE